jgi:hypothetical protein
MAKDIPSIILQFDNALKHMDVQFRIMAVPDVLF